jgi:C-terminal processing protease CtpA/Prc
MSSLLSVLRDGHINLFTPYGQYHFPGIHAGSPANFLGFNVVKSYLSSDYGTTASGYIHYGKISNDLGYIYIGPNFVGDVGIWSDAMDTIIDSLKDTKGIIVDIRGNGGGQDDIASAVAGRFTDNTRIYGYVKWKIMGQDHSNFTDFTLQSFTSMGNKHYTKPVAILINRYCFSAAEAALLMFKSIPGVISIGDTTGGGMGNPIVIQLPNGWTYWVPRSIEYTVDKKDIEEIGLAPDIPVQISAADSIASHDTILQRAIVELNK